jgi:hypothetical protein
MKIIDKYLVIGFFYGSFALISLDDKTTANILTFEAKNKGFVRDIHCHVTPDEHLYLLVLFVNQDEKLRSYEMGHFVFS